eukprot:TRINITY_DN10699_c0_g2_i1.p2 TRINITY_DN10699_c0_g2~~TRINITY_DN10699_c0_g2_i1.p2  ORF type:complete len:485 (+),score=149.16 TRINITY_DN10699_c0_g2_i1:93-1457(+)
MAAARDAEAAGDPPPNDIACHLEFGGHADWVTSLWVQGDRLYSASCDDSVRVWGRDGQLLHKLESPTPVNCVLTIRVPRYGRIVVAGGRGDLLRCWRDEDGSSAGAIGNQLEDGGPEATTWALAVWDGVVFAGGSRRSIRAVCVSSGELLYTLEGHTGSVRCLCIEEDGVLYSAGEDNVIRLWDLAQKRTRQTFKGHSTSVLSLAATRSALYSGSYDGQIRAWSRANGRAYCIASHSGPVNSLLVRDQTLWSAGGDGYIVGWSTVTGQCSYRVHAHHESVLSLAAAHESEPMLYSGSKDQAVKCWLLPAAPDQHHASDSEDTVGPSGETSSVAISRRKRSVSMQDLEQRNEEAESLRQELQRALGKQREMALQVSALAQETADLRTENSHLMQMVRSLTIENQRLLNKPAQIQADPACDAASGAGSDLGDTSPYPVVDSPETPEESPRSPALSC